MHQATTVTGSRLDPGVRVSGGEDGVVTQAGSASPSPAFSAAERGFRVDFNRKRKRGAYRQSEGRAEARGLLARRQVPIPLQDRPCPGEAPLDALMHPAAGVVLFRDPLRRPEPQRVVLLREPLRLAFQRQQKLTVPVPRARPDRGAGNPAQTSSMAATSRSSTRRSPPSSGNAAPRGRRTETDTPGRSIRSIRAPSARRSPSSVAPPSAASRTSGGASRVTRPSITPACIQKGASGRSAYGSSQAAMPQGAAARSAAVWRRTGKGARSGRPERWRRLAQALR